MYKGPPLKILIAGKPSSGKGSICPMISRAYRGVYLASGNLLRSEVRVCVGMCMLACMCVCACVRICLLAGTVKNGLANDEDAKGCRHRVSQQGEGTTTENGRCVCVRARVVRAVREALCCGTRTKL